MAGAKRKLAAIPSADVAGGGAAEAPAVETTTDQT
jgi:hypothetical protein